MITRKLHQLHDWFLQEEADIAAASATAADHVHPYSLGRGMLYSAVLSCAASLLIHKRWTSVAGVAAFTSCSAVAVYAFSVPLLLRFFADNEQRVGKLTYNLWKMGCTGSTLFALGVSSHWLTLGALVATLGINLFKPRDGYSIYRIPIFLIFLK